LRRCGAGSVGPPQVGLARAIARLPEHMNGRKRRKRRSTSGRPGFRGRVRGPAANGRRWWRRRRACHANPYGWSSPFCSCSACLNGNDTLYVAPSDSTAPTAWRPWPRGAGTGRRGGGSPRGPRGKFAHRPPCRNRARRALSLDRSGVASRCSRLSGGSMSSSIVLSSRARSSTRGNGAMATRRWSAIQRDTSALLAAVSLPGIPNFNPSGSRSSAAMLKRSVDEVLLPSTC
jgi:hypothetical protein